VYADSNLALRLTLVFHDETVAADIRAE